MITDKVRNFVGPILSPFLSPSFRASTLGAFEDLFAQKNKPLRHIPRKLLGAYTMNGQIPLGYRYLNDAEPSHQSRVYTKEMISSYLEKIKNMETFYYGKTDAWLYQALEKFDIKDKKVAILGSVRPLYESMCLFYGGAPTTIEYNKIISDDPRITTITVDEFSQTPRQFDAAFSISSFEHDGLGRYGDPLNPEGDLVAMKKTKFKLKPNGLLFLAVPIGKDKLVWNAHRIYGKIRLPKLLAGWKLLETFGFEENLTNKDGYEQPVFVLRNKVDG